MNMFVAKQKLYQELRAPKVGPVSLARNSFLFFFFFYLWIVSLARNSWRNIKKPRSTCQRRVQGEEEQPSIVHPVILSNLQCKGDPKTHSSLIHYFGLKTSWSQGLNFPIFLLSPSFLLSVLIVCLFFVFWHAFLWMIWICKYTSHLG